MTVYLRTNIESQMLTQYYATSRLGPRLNETQIQNCRVNQKAVTFTFPIYTARPGSSDGRRLGLRPSLAVGKVGITVHFTSEQLLPFGIAERSTSPQTYLPGLVVASTGPGLN